MFSSYVALMSNIIDSEPSTIEEAVEKQEWKDAMMEEYQSIMKNDVWEVVLRPEGKSVVTSKLIYKIKHVADGSVKRDLWLEDSPSKREKTMTKLFLL
jgi:hypothetical protein